MAATRKKAKPADAQDQIITDPASGLEWSMTVGGAVNWKAAMEIAATSRIGGHDDWQLPSPAESLTIVDYAKRNPAANTELFPDMKSDWYWTRTPLASSPGVYAWSVVFDYGYVYCGVQYYEAFVRLVRRARASQ